MHEGSIADEGRVTVTDTAGDAVARASKRPPAWGGLSAKFILLTILFVMTIEVLILIPSVANFRQTWLVNRLEQARAASGIFDSALGGDEMLQKSLLMALDAEKVVLRDGEMSEMIGETNLSAAPSVVVREELFSPLPAIAGAFEQLRNGGGRLIRILGRPDPMGREVELVVRDDELQSGMLTYMRNIILISLFIAVVTALLIYLAVRALLIRPVQRMTEAMLAFAAAPQDAGAVLQPSDRSDEVGLAERELRRMQDQLARTLTQQRRLAELGLAVSKINHDMRNILASAQLVTDRLADVDDPLVKRVAPRLIRAIDRAVGYSEGVLEYGRANEARPQMDRFELAPLVADVRDVVLADPSLDIALVDRIPTAFMVTGDREQLLRALLNLSRNAVQAMAGAEGRDAHSLIFSARRDGGEVVILVGDTGPGVPERSRATLFSAFGHTSKSAGSGLGLAIARELVEAHGGTLRLDATGPSGTTFEIRLPERTDTSA